MPPCVIIWTVCQVINDCLSIGTNFEDLPLWLTRLAAKGKILITYLTVSLVGYGSM